MEQDLLEAIQGIPMLKCFRVWNTNRLNKGYWATETYNSKHWCVKGFPTGEKKYILVSTCSITGTTYEWI